jgi:hypothetical protein
MIGNDEWPETRFRPFIIYVCICRCLELRDSFQVADIWSIVHLPTARAKVRREEQ